MRVYLVWLIFLLLCMYAYKDWFKGLCALFLYMAIIERPDMPRGVGGIPGLNPWNLLLINVCIAAYLQISKDKLSFKMPPRFKTLSICYLMFIIISFLREIVDLDGVREYYDAIGGPPFSVKRAVLNHFLNPLKYAVPGLLLVYGCNSAQRLKIAMSCVLIACILIALQIINIMPISSLGASGSDMQQRAILKIDARLGYFRSDVAIFLAGAAWAIFAFQSIFKGRMTWLFIMGTVCVVAFAIALTGGRSGQGIFLLIGAILAWYKWRKLFLLAPVGLIVLVTFVPTVMDRFTQGFVYDPNDSHFKKAETVEEGQMKSITSGRTTIWPFVIEGIFESPLIGHGGNAMQRMGIATRLWVEHREQFPHPHNAYLQLLLDNGIILGLPIFLLYVSACLRAFTLFRDKEDQLASTAGVFAFVFIFSFLVGGVAQQSFYPGSSSVFVIAGIGLAIRVYEEKYGRNKLANLETDKSPTWNNEPVTKKKGKGKGKGKSRAKPKASLA